ncbi:hypothetical protein CANCADRAFT_117617 [Tortispora caseinolytica NRRL Y-17796]|uniref:BZIP domain-containing protein n=1 Tax=Tortispora caseinolytica NRRL Y-17796 TaxID=767744 RepID=A0A1E4THG5_9ASCO|nr:hypothetical protein CANCADRAFT_117617 [Tortispora caseinolytica NRRL Y-17796]
MTSNAAFNLSDEAFFEQLPSAFDFMESDLLQQVPTNEHMPSSDTVLAVEPPIDLPELSYSSTSPSSQDSDHSDVTHKRKDSGIIGSNIAEYNGSARSKRKVHSKQQSDTSKGALSVDSVSNTAIDPESKRKSQNRAAQRAFRERKEQRLKELNARVEQLEESSKEVNAENSFLKAQIARLQEEVAAYRKRTIALMQGKTTLSSATSTPSSIADSANDAQFTFEFPFYEKKPLTTRPDHESQGSPESTTKSQNANFSDNLSPGSVSDFSALFSPASITSSSSLEPTMPELSLPAPPIKGTAKEDPGTETSNEKGDFCSKLNEACGNCDQPVPKTSTNLPPSAYAGFEYYRDPLFSFDAEDYADFDTETVVPADEPGLDCGELWGMITTHPRFDEFDIDGLCRELQTKAKCSEKGVIIAGSDVEKTLAAALYK